VCDIWLGAARQQKQPPQNNPQDDNIAGLLPQETMGASWRPHGNSQAGERFAPRPGPALLSRGSRPLPTRGARCAVDAFAGAQAVAIQYTASGDEILACPVC
jgi:hypothetical protein